MNDDDRGADRGLERFAREYFHLIGAAVAMDLPDYLEVDLPPAWRGWFGGRTRLAIAFSREAFADHPLAQRLTFGAPLLEEIAASLETHGDLLAGTIPDADFDLRFPLVPGSVAIAGETRRGRAWVARVWYRVTLAADEVRERIEAVSVGGDGVPAGLGESLVRALLPAEALDAPLAYDPVAPAELPPPAHLLALARGELARRLADEVALFRAAKSEACEEEIRRLSEHHEAQARELEKLSSEGARAQADQLPEVMLRRVEEVRESFRVAVKAAPLAAAVFDVPLAFQRVRYEPEAPGTPVVEAELTGCPALPATAELACQACGAAAAVLAICPTCATLVCPTHRDLCRFCRLPACDRCRGMHLPAPEGIVAGGGECPACRALCRAAPGQAGARSVTAVGRWLGGRIFVHDGATGQFVASRWVGPWVTWFDSRFRR